jgi:hypothetical protein
MEWFMKHFNILAIIFLSAAVPRVRAEALTGDLWAPDPACYLTDAEIS